MQQNKYKYLKTIFFILSVLFISPILLHETYEYDERIILCGADRVLHGELPYRDFWTMYSPGQYYILSILFRLIGRSLLTERLFDLFIRILIATFSFIIIRKISPRIVPALAGWTISILWLYRFEFPGYPMYTFLALFLFSIFCLLEYEHKRHLKYLIFSGLSSGAAILFRHELGAAALVLMAFMVIVIIVMEKTQFSENMGFTFTSSIKKSKSTRIFLFFVCALAPPLTVYSALAFSCNINDMANQLFIFPLREFPRFRAIPYPSVQELFPAHINSITSLTNYAKIFDDTAPFFIFPLICITGLTVSFLRIIRTKHLETMDRSALLINFAGLIFLKQTSVRSDLIHLLPCAILSVISFSLTWNLIKENNKTHRYANFFCISTFVLLTLLPAGFWGKEMYKLYTRSPEQISPVPLEYRQAADYIKNHTSPDQDIYIGVKNHDRLVINNALLYFLCDRRCGTKYHELHPGLVTTRNVQQEIVNELSENNVRYIVLCDSSFWKEPNQSQVDAGIDILDDYISRNFEQETSFGRINILAQYQFYARKSF